MRCERLLVRVRENGVEEEVKNQPMHSGRHWEIQSGREERMRQIMSMDEIVDERMRVRESIERSK